MLRQLTIALAWTLIGCASAQQPHWPVSSNQQFCQHWSTSQAELRRCREYGFVVGRGISAATLLKIESVLELPEKHDVLRVWKVQKEIRVITGDQYGGEQYTSGRVFYLEKIKGKWRIKNLKGRMSWVT